MGLGNLALGSISSAVVVGSIPNVSGTASETTLRGKHAEGLTEIGKTFPTHGKLIGARMVLKQVKKLKKKGKIRL